MSKNGIGENTCKAPANRYAPGAVWAGPHWVASGCRRMPAGGDSFKDAYETFYMALGKCFTHCQTMPGMKYFGISGRRCICGKTSPGNLVSREQCDLRCGGNSKELCGGVADAASVYTMVNCTSPSGAEEEQIFAGKLAQMVASYDSHQGEACGESDEQDLCVLNGSPKLIATLEECQTACWEADGADVCRGFTYDKVQSKCTFHTDVSDSKRKTNSDLTCYFKKFDHEFDWSKKANH